MVALTTELRGNQNFNIIPTKSKSLRELFSVFFSEYGIWDIQTKVTDQFFFFFPKRKIYLTSFT